MTFELEVKSELDGRATHHGEGDCNKKCDEDPFSPYSPEGIIVLLGKVTNQLEEQCDTISSLTGLLSPLLNPTGNTPAMASTLEPGSKDTPDGASELNRMICSISTAINSNNNTLLGIKHSIDL